MRPQFVSIILTLLFINGMLACKKSVKSISKDNITKSHQIENHNLELDDQIWQVFQDKSGDFWFGTNGRGIYNFDGKKLIQYTTKNGLLSDFIRGVQEDAYGNIFIETPDGISKFDGLNFTTLKVNRSIESEWKIEANDLWFNCNGNNLYRFDGEWLYPLRLPKKDLKLLNIDAEEYFEEMTYSPYSVYGIDKDKDGNVWFGTLSAGAFRFDGNSFLWVGEKELSILPDGRVPGVRSILQDKEGYFWLSNFYSKYKIDSKLDAGYERTEVVNLPEDLDPEKLLYFNSGLSDKNGNLWMTTYGGGVWKYDGKALTNQEIHNGSKGVLLVSIYEDNEGVIWLGTDNDGVYKQVGKHFEKFEVSKE